MALTLSGDGIVSANIVDNAITSSKIADGTIVNDDINASANIPASKLSGTGKVLQVVSMSSGSDTTYTNVGWTDTMYTLNITPSSTASKILVMWDDEVTVQGDSNFGLRIRRGAVTAAIPYASAGNFGSANQHGGGYSFHYLDSPSTTSSTTYTIQIITTGTIRVNGESGTGTLTLMEIGA